MGLTFLVAVTKHPIESRQGTLERRWLLSQELLYHAIDLTRDDFTIRSVGSGDEMCIDLEINLDIVYQLETRCTSNH